MKSHKIGVLIYNDWGNSFEALSDLAIILSKDSRFEVIVLAMPSKVESNTFYDLNTTKSLYKFAKEFDVEICPDIMPNRHLQCVIGFDENFSVRFYPQDFKTQYFINTRPYSGLRPKCWDNANVGRFMKLCHIDYGVHLHSRKLPICEFAELKYYDLIFAPSAFHAKLISFTQQDEKYSEIFPVGCAKLEQILHLAQNLKKSASSLLCCCYMPRWNSTDGYGTFERYIESFLAMAEKSKLEFIFRPHPNMFDSFNNAGMGDKIDAIFKRIESCKYANIDVNEDLSQSFKKADVLISDASSMLVYSFLSGKPTIFTQNLYGSEVNNWTLCLLQGCFVVNTKDELFSLLESFSDDFSKTFMPKLALREQILKQLFTFTKIHTSQKIRDILLKDFIKELGFMR